MVDKQNAHTRKGIFLVDASAGFRKDGPKNRLRDQDIHKIVDVCTRQLELPKFSRFVSYEEIEKNDWNLNIPRYIDSQTPEDRQDIEGHLKGGIPAADVDAPDCYLNRYWAICPNLGQALFQPLRPGYVQLAVEKSAIKSTIHGHPEFAAFIKGMNQHFAVWRDTRAAELRKLGPGSHPKEVIVSLAESLLEHYRGKPLIDAYDVYQHLLDYWDATMQDDCYLIAADGWKAETTRVIETDTKGRKKDKGWTCDLVPKSLLIARYFAEEQAALDGLTAELESASARLSELEEEHGGEEGLFSEFDKVNKANVVSRLREIRGDKEALDEAAALNEWLTLSEQESGLKKFVKEAEAALDAEAHGHYPQLTESDIQTLVVDDKWLGALDAVIHGEMDRISQSLTQRVKELAERYETPLPDMVSRVADLEASVNRHLERMGFRGIEAGLQADRGRGYSNRLGGKADWISLVAMYVAC